MFRWVGLRGAVPILFAIYPMVAHIEQSGLLFNVVFLSTIISLAVQGTTVSGMANLLGLAYEQREATFNVNLSEDVKSALTEVEVNEAMMQSGRTLQELTLPENTLVMMVCRDGAYFVPKGKTELRLGDKLLVISDRSEELAASYKIWASTKSCRFDLRLFESRGAKAPAARTFNKWGVRDGNRCVR